MKTTTIIITVILAIVIGSYYFIDSNKNSVNYSESKDEIKTQQDQPDEQTPTSTHGKININEVCEGNKGVAVMVSVPVLKPIA